jgi:hypothetical protein
MPGALNQHACAAAHAAAAAAAPIQTTQGAQPPRGVPQLPPLAPGAFSASSRPDGLIMLYVLMMFQLWCKKTTADKVTSDELQAF